MSSHLETTEPRYYGMEYGTVVSNADPKILGRVKIRVPGIIDETDWAFPLGGGSAQRGAWRVPAVGADVAVWFKSGDPHGHCSYLASMWGLPGGKSEAPTPISADPTVTAADAHMLTVTETDRYIVTIDDRPGKESLTLTDKASGDRIRMDGNAFRCTIGITGTLQIDAGAVIINGARIVLNGRAIVPFGGQIG